LLLASAAPYRSKATSMADSDDVSIDVSNGAIARNRHVTKLIQNILFDCFFLIKEYCDKYSFLMKIK
jgi:hypothetical protein